MRSSLDLLRGPGGRPCRRTRCSCRLAATVAAPPCGKVGARGQQNALGLALERNLAGTPDGSFQRAITGEGQGEDGRAGIVGKDAGVSCRPPGAELWSVEQRSDDKRRPDGPEQVRNVVDLGEVFAHERDDGDPSPTSTNWTERRGTAIASHQRM